MLIDTESPEGRALVELARLAIEYLNVDDPYCETNIEELFNQAKLNGLVDRNWMPTDLAKLPEGL